MAEKTLDSIPFAKPFLGVEEEEACLRVIRSAWLTTGPETMAFEREFAEFIGSPNAIAVSSATAGLHLAYDALGLSQGDKVLVSPFTFTASAETLRYLGAEAVFCDIGPDDFNISVEAAQSILKRDPAIKGITAVHVGGLPCDMDALHAVKGRDRFLVEDAAHAFPARIGPSLAGTVSDVGVFSFYATKTITTGEGGMVVCSNPDLAKRMKMMRLHGMDREAWDRYRKPGANYRYAIVEAGYKYNLTDLASAIGRVQLGRAEKLLSERKDIAAVYNNAFRQRDYLCLPPRPDAVGHAWHLYSLRLRLDRLSIDRDEFINQLSALGIGTSVHFIPLHIMPYWAKRYSLQAEDFPRSLAAFQSLISLPIWPGMGSEAVQRVVQAVLAVGDRYRIKTA